MKGWPLTEPLAKWLTVIASLLHAGIIYQPETTYLIVSHQNFITML